MSQLTDKYGGAFTFAQQLGCTNLEAKEENGRITITGTCPTQYDVNRVWDKVKATDPELNDNDLILNLTAQRTDVFGEYEVQSGDTLSSIAKEVTGGRLTYQQIFEANRDILSDADKIKPGQRLKIPSFSVGQKA